MARVRRREARDLNVVPHQVVWRGQRVKLPLKEFFLGVPARPPAQNTAHLQIFAQNVPHHVGRPHPLGRAFVVGTAGGMHMVIAREPVPLGQVDPALKLKPLMRIAPGWHRKPTGLGQILGPACELHVVITGRKRDRFTVGSVNLRMKKEIRGQPLALRRVDPAQAIANQE